ncbi:uncharacterized protein [Solanum lycopersicum]|uniref:uncharacterized protein n=1 Tax=Solanum lycopersicum TaxID=4081 RepID=UPI0008FECE40|nr:uncharacterized protein LOC109119826 [Solanum lycopersicum]
MAGDDEPVIVQENTNRAANIGQEIDYNHPLFLSPSDVSGNQIISFQLTGRNKLGMVDGSCDKEKYSENMWNHWDRVDAIVQSWLMNSVSKSLLGGIMYAATTKAVWEDLQERFTKVDGSRTFNLHKEIATLTQGVNSVTVYFSKLKTLWEELEALVPPPGCNCERSKEFIVHLQKLKLFQFLMGLNDTYNQARSQILLMSPLPSINQAYAMVMGDESQKSVSAMNGILGANPMSHTGNYESALYSRTNGNQKFTRNSHLYCDVCKIRGHNKDNCWKIVGYPPEFKFKKRKLSKGGSAAYNVSAKENTQNEVLQAGNEQSEFKYGSDTNVFSHGKGSSSMDQVQSKPSRVEASHFTQDQYNHIIQMLAQHSPQVN